MSNKGLLKPQSSGLIKPIEGMRALAVLVVLLFHLDVPWFNGGFIGVDLFFVISGFIITRNLLKDLNKGTFSFLSFYHRRVRRLMPALIVTCLVTVAGAYILLPPRELAETAKSALYALSSLSNFLFWYQADYFDAASHTKPLLHTWSLGVEEQFYLLWPALLLLAFRRGLILPSIILLIVLSAASAILFNQDHASAVFYLFPFRIHQLATGALVAVTGFVFRGLLADILLLSGMVIFCILVLLMSNETPAYFSALSVTLLGFLLISAREARIAEKLLGNTLALWIGARSYAIYLVHWPIVVLFKLSYSPTLTLVAKGGLIIACLFATVLLHTFIEKPFRLLPQARANKFSRFATPTLFAMMFVGIFITANIWGYRGFEWRNSDEINKILAQVDLNASDRLRLLRTQICHASSGYRMEFYDENICAPMSAKHPNILVIGDSIAGDVYLLLSSAYPNASISQATGGSCSAYLELNAYKGCQRLNEYRFNVLARRDYDAIVVASKWRHSRLDGLEQTLSYLGSHQKNVIVFGPGVIFSDDVDNVISKSRSLAEAETFLSQHEDRQRELADEIRERARGVAQFIDYSAIQCKEVCDIVDDSELLYIDRFHITVHGAAYFGSRLASEYPDLFEKH